MRGCSLETHETFLAVDQNHSIKTVGTCSYSLTKSKDDIAREITKLEFEAVCSFCLLSGRNGLVCLWLLTGEPWVRGWLSSRESRSYISRQNLEFSRVGRAVFMVP